ncbi:MAG: hypothetical protein WD002_14250 [Pseudomonadales bacterium]
MQRLEINYRGARLALEFDTSPAARLKVNGIVREHVRSDQLPITLKLTSTVQTDYEWHEFIEGLVIYSETGVRASLIANSQELASEEFPREIT